MDILWIYLNKLKYRKFLSNLKKLNKRIIIFTPNPEIILKTLEDKDFRKDLLKADFLLADWTWLFLAYQIIDFKKRLKNLNKSIKIVLSIILLPYFVFNIIFRKKYISTLYGDKICWSDLSKDILEFACRRNIKITIIDLYNPYDKNKVEMQKIFSKKLIEVYRNIKFDYYIYDESKKEKIIDEISKSETKILFSTLWMKKQEKSIIEIMDKCKNIKIWMWIWSSFDYIIWFQKRAPKFWRNIWIEWLYRLITWPKKINRLKRLYNAIIKFTYKVIINY